MNPQTIFTGTNGLNNTVDPASLQRDQSGKLSLIECNNIAVGDNGRINRLKGASLMLPAPYENIHSLISYNGNLIFAGSKSLWQLSLSGEITKLTDLPTDNPVYYHQLYDGSDDILFWCNGTAAGRVIGNNSYSWESGQYIGPETTRKVTTVPNGYICEYILGRMMIASGPDVFISEPTDSFHFNLFRGELPFDEGITLLAGLENGFWVSDKRNIYWIASDGVAFERQTAASYPALKGKPVLIDSGDLPLQLPFYGTCYIALTTKGFCVLGQGGFFLNLTERNLYFQDQTWTSYAAVKHGQYVYTYADNGVGLVMNTRNIAVTQHNCYPFNSFAYLNGRVYGANVNGIYKITGENVEAYFTVYVNMQRASRLRFLHMHGEFAGSIQATITSDENITRAYTALPRKTGLKQHEFKYPIRRDNGIGTYWKIKTENIGGIDFSVDRLEVTPVQRRLYRAT